MTATPATGASVSELRAQLRSWRRGRATTKVTEVMQDAYVALFSVLMLGAMLANVVLTLRREAGAACLSEGCGAARALLPWLVAATVLAGVLGVARLLGPVFVSPAAASWLLDAPVDRAALLRRRLVVLALLGAASVLAAALPLAVVSGLAPAGVVGFSVAAAAAGAGVVGLAAWSQARGGREAQAAQWLLVLAVWVGLLGLVEGWWADAPSLLAAPLASALVAAPALLLVPAWRGLARLHRRQLSPGGGLSASLSGAMAGLDLPLALDVVTAHRWRQRGWVRPVRRGPAGPAALVARDVVRLRRRPATVLVLLLAAVVPWAVADTGGGRITLLALVLAAFLALVPQLLGLRVLVRTRSLVRLLPMTDQAARGATLVVPGVGAVAFGLAALAPTAYALDVPGTAALGPVLAGALGGLAAAVWWTAGPSVDWGKPAVSTPMGAVQPGLAASLLRGPDVVLLTSAPLLLAPDLRGTACSLALSAIVVSVVLGRRS